MCATNSRLREETIRGNFRGDLFYRINGLTIELPSLRERTDFQAITHKLLALASPDRTIHLGTDVLHQMERHTWPGNLRQLASVLRTACAMLDPHEDCIEWRHLADDLVEDLLAHTAAPMPIAPIQASSNLQDLARTAIEQTLAHSKGNVSQAARILGVSRQTLYRKIAPGRAIP